jgi:hypothetical protein
MDDIIQQSPKNIIRYIDGLSKSNHILNPTILLESMSISLPTLQACPPNELYLPIVYDNLNTPYVDGILLWEQLEWESDENYRLFREYREKGIYRSTFEIAKSHNMPPLELSRLAKLMQWYLRVEAHDNYYDSLHQNLVKLRRREISDSHFRVAQELFIKCANYCEENIEIFKPKEIIEMMKLASDLGRNSVGLYESTIRSSDSPSTIVNVNQNNIPNISNGTQNVLISESKSITNLEQEKERLAGILNIMNQIGALNPEESEIEELDMENIIIAYDGNEGGEVNEGT